MNNLVIFLWVFSKLLDLTNVQIAYEGHTFRKNVSAKFVK